jgi:hypothetical protein
MSLQSFLKIFVGSVLLLIVGCGANPPAASTTSEAWNAANDPFNLDSTYERRLGFLPVQGQTPNTPWSDTYWPDRQGGIANRWAAGGGAPWGQALLSYQQVASLTPAQLASLSPAEKYDIFIGRFDYPLTVSELARTRPTDPAWAGVCHGWAPAAINYYEPRAVTLTSAHGIAVPFGASDVKALLSYYDGRVDVARQRVLGQRCNHQLSASPGAAGLPECRDVNAGAFHVVMANQLGLRQRAFLADVTRDAEVWNQPVNGFSSRVLQVRGGASPGAAFGTVQEADIETTIRYVVETAPSWQPIGGHEAAKTYQYRVELAADGSIIGGEWYSGDRPDFLWTMAPPSAFQMAGLYQIYEASIRAP